MTTEDRAERPDQLERLVQVVFIAPIGLLARMIEQGPVAGDRVANGAPTPRRFRCPSLSSGFRRLRREVDEQIRADRERSAARRAAPPRAADPEQSIDDVPVRGVDPVEEPVDAGPAVSDLALPDYEHLPASQIVAMLGDLDTDELREIEIYERANRNRRTVLGKLSQLRE
jgi:hypothetical protein